MIKLVDLTKIYNTGESVGIGIQGINLELNVGEFVAIVGASGSGKTTLLNIISGMDTHTEGEMFINDVSVSNFDSEELENYRRGNVAFIFQNYHLIDSYTVLENVMVELIIKGMNKKEAKEKALELLEKVGMSHRIKNRASNLSGGEKQRVVIARALASDAKILACDEPTGNLDEKNTKEIMSLIKSVSQDKLVLFVTHDESTIKDNATRIIKIRDGKIESDSTLVDSKKRNLEICVPEENSWNTRLYIATRNMIRTPKKTFFVFFVFLIVSFILLFSIAYIPLNVSASDVSIIEFNMFQNRDENRIVVYQNEKFDGNYNVDNVEIYKDDYLLEYDFRASSTSSDLNDFLYKNSKMIYNESQIQLTAGRLPSSDDEVIIILDNSFSDDFYSNILNSNIKIRFALDKNTGSYFGQYYNVVGFAIIENMEKEMSYYYLSKEGRISFYDSLKSKITFNKDSQYFSSDFCFVYKEKKHEVIINNELAADEIIINFKYQNEDFKLYLGTVEIDLSKYNYDYLYDSTYSYNIQISYQVALRMIEESNYRVSIISQQENLNETIQTLKANENLDIFPLIEAKKEIEQYDYQSILKNLFSFAFVLIEIIVTIFVTTLITTLILGTKKKEIGILRVIGLNKKDVFNVLFIEVVFLMIISVAINIIIAGCFKFFNSSFSYAIIFDNLWKLLITILILIITSIYISYRWNKIIFKMTARDVLRAGE